MTLKHASTDKVSKRFLEYMHKPVNVGELDNPGGKAQMKGQCGDTIGVHVAIDNDILKQIRVQTNGCAYTLVCAEAMSVLAQKLSVEEALKLEPKDIADELGGLPEDHLHCARLALNSLGEAMANYYTNLNANIREKEE
ncbi:MAG: iron-sulfur cluster assembly scaffold protein [Pseudodesulfovibrio sp.]|jgi:nitrogen fixation NifU-like protein|nr:iron-sulfur cluster assembly scaffold protein [Pseudodesulfovibrio sp.]